jgi:hypothetical protein
LNKKARKAQMHIPKFDELTKLGKQMTGNLWNTDVSNRFSYIIYAANLTNMLCSVRDPLIKKMEEAEHITLFYIL